jgi:Putative DNA-binding domain
MVRLPRAEAVLGVSLADCDEVALGRLVDGAIREDADLEFKSELYGNSDSDRRALAGDVAALANAGGGLIILGVREEDAVAVELTPVPLSDAEELRIRQIVASNVAPHVAFDLHRLESGDERTKGWYLLAVPKSSWAPHAVRVGDALRYPRRDGAGIRLLAESEVADAYRNRFTAAQVQVQRLTDIDREGSTALSTLGDECWLTVAVVRDNAGEMKLTRVGVREMESFVRGLEGVPQFTDAALRYYSSVAMAGHRRVVLTLNPDSAGAPRGGLLHLHTDGSSFVAVDLGWRPRINDQPADWVNVDDERLTQELFWSLRAAAGHAVGNCHTGGDAAVEARLFCYRGAKLSHGRGHFSGGYWTEQQVNGTAPSRHTIALDAVSESALELVIATRTVVTDLLQSFGLAECPQITANGTIRHRYWRNTEHVQEQCTQLGLATTEDTIG